MKKIILINLLLVLFFFTKANDVLISTVSLTGKSTVGALATHFTNVQFDIAWKNSWHTSTNESNYDGCWIFAKFRKQNTSVWQHCSLNATGNTAATGSILQPSADGKGAWIYRNADGIGNVSYAANQLRWNYGADGVLDNENVEVKVFAVEMVYVPQGSFNLGNASNTETFKFRDGAVNTWFPVTSEAAITCGTAAGNLYAASSFTNSGIIPAAYPKGYNAFWCMKYEFSRQQYVDFLNTLDQANATAMNITANGTITAATGSVPNMVITQPEIAASYLTNGGILAWLDWAAMRPMTEFEYEKACRGANNLPSPGEYAWGNNTLSAINIPTAQGTSTETWGSGNANCSGGPGVPMRTGALATASSTRTSCGATFYGIMEMSGNCRELTIVANGAGRNFTGLHGDGVLTSTAESNTANWPSTATTNDILQRGGYYANSTAQMQISDRSVGTDTYSTFTNSQVLGGRGIRTAE